MLAIQMGFFFLSFSFGPNPNASSMAHQSREHSTFTFRTVSGVISSEKCISEYNPVRMKELTEIEVLLYT